VNNVLTLKMNFNNIGFTKFTSNLNLRPTYVHLEKGTFITFIIDRFSVSELNF